MSMHAPTTLHEIRQRVAVCGVFHSVPLKLKGDYIAVLSSHLMSPATRNDPYGTESDKSNPAHYSKVAATTQAPEALNAKVNADATARAVRYMTRSNSPTVNHREALPDETVYYVTNTETGNVVALITADGTVHVMPGKHAFRSDLSMRAVINSLHTARTTLAYESHAGKR